MGPSLIGSEVAQKTPLIAWIVSLPWGRPDWRLETRHGRTMKPRSLPVASMGPSLIGDGNINWDPTTRPQEVVQLQWGRP